MKRSLGLISLSLMAVIGQAQAADDLGGFVDMRLGYETFNTKYRLRTGGLEVDDNFDETHRITLTWLGSLGLRSYGGCLWGLGGTWYYNRDQLPGATTDFTYQTWLVQGHLGYGVPIGTNVQLEFVPYIGFGRAYLRVDDLPRSGNWQNGDDATWELGLNTSVVYTFNNGFQLGVNGRYFFNEAGITDDNSGTRFSFNIQDFSVGAFIGVRL